MISLKDAQKIVEGCLKKARDENLKPITIAVLDTRGILVSSAMEDNSSLIRPDIAFAKAMSGLIKEELSSIAELTRIPRVSRTAIVIGFKFSSLAFFKQPSTIFWASFKLIIFSSFKKLFMVSIIFLQSYKILIF